MLYQQDPAGIGRHGSAEESRAIAARLDEHVRPDPMWHVPLRLLRPRQVLGVLELCAAWHGARAAEVLLDDIQDVLRYAIGQGQIPGSPVLDLVPHLLGLDRIDGGEGLARTIKDVVRLRRILRDAEFVRVAWQIRGAHWATALTAQDPLEVLSMAWADLDLKGGAWHSPSKRQHEGRLSLAHVPLPRQVVAYLRRLEPKGPYVFHRPAAPEIAISHWSVGQFLRRQMGLRFKHSLTSWRTAFDAFAKDEPPLMDGGLDCGPDCIAFILDGLLLAPTRTVNEARVRPLLQRWADALCPSETTAVPRKR